ncbi:MAG: class I SAM-dependent methyltransferase [Candidatus Rokuibacteriota bacterium]
MGLEASRQFWDEKARENAYWYVSSFGPYHGRDLPQFWASGFRIWEDLQAVIGYDPKPTDCVVEIGCGVGRLSRAIAPQVGQLHAFDISKKMLLIAQQGNLSNATWYVSEGVNLRPLPDACADLVLAYCVLQHLPSHDTLRQYIREMLRVAKPGAFLAFTLTPRDWRASLTSAMRLRAGLRERVRPSGPKGLYKKEWLGIRPSLKQVMKLSPVSLKHASLHGDKSLFWGTRPA